MALEQSETPQISSLTPELGIDTVAPGIQDLTVSATVESEVVNHTENQLQKNSSNGRSKVLMWDDEAFKGYGISEREKFCVETYLETFNLNEVHRRMCAKFGAAKVSWPTMRKFFTKPWVRKYLAGRIDEIARANGLSRERWEIIGLDVLDGKRKMNPVQQAVWRDLGKAKRFLGEESSGVKVGRAEQINILQGNGKA